MKSFLAISLVLFTACPAFAQNWRTPNPDQPNGYHASEADSHYHGKYHEPAQPQNGYHASEARSHYGGSRCEPSSGWQSSSDSRGGGRWGGSSSESSDSRWGGRWGGSSASNGDSAWGGYYSRRFGGGMSGGSQNYAQTMADHPGATGLVGRSLQIESEYRHGLLPQQQSQQQPMQPQQAPNPYSQQPNSYSQQSYYSANRYPPVRRMLMSGGSGFTNVDTNSGGFNRIYTGDSNSGGFNRIYTGE